MEIFWIVIRIITALGILSGLAIWILPKKWIMRSEIAAELLSDGGPAPWKGANQIGKAIYVVFYSSAGILMVMLTVVHFLEGTG